ncbi:histidine phosphatase family protein [Phenylobacterium sp.]|uniref:histidine phosphatase family protein n=1 Tax=Phenylobacterium sp. TaxID=1871053 RepID=UPI00272F257A|nr:histidine phosphatase family protein [Phenylobacterium sp.]MDP1600797.1 histidine phosphatase family protein [Phenylobacterium sp.]MDP3590626.1 histidine phosphatase family protein [Phenylobacterium sp.]
MIYLLRHGQTNYNHEGRMQGQLESQLTDLGMAQAQAMADLLKAEITDTAGWRLLASPLKRTRQSAAIVGATLGLEVEIEPALIEVGCGAWEDRLYADLAKEHPGAFAGRDWFFQAPEGERFEDVDGRVRPWLAAQAPEPRKLIAVAHGVSGSLLRGAYLGLSHEETLAQDMPQDAIFRLAEGAVQRLSCAEVTA